MTKPGPSCLSTLALDELLAKELSAERAELARVHIAQCEHCQLRFNGLEQDWARFAVEAPALGAAPLGAAPLAPLQTATSQMPTASRPRAARSFAQTRWFQSSLISAGGALTGAVAAAAALTLWLRTDHPLPASTPRSTPTHGLELRPHGEDPQGATPSPAAQPAITGAMRESPVEGRATLAPSVRTKGAHGALSVFVRRGAQLVDSPAPMELQPGDGVRFALSLEHAAHCGVWGIEAAGQASPYFAGAELESLAAGPGQLLSGAVQLDESVGRERFIAVCCDHPQASAPITALLQETAGPARAGNSAAVPSLPRGCTLTQMPFSKVSRQ